uniref:DNA-directed RNA polymerase subunit beta'' n=1 Tax=Astrephomene gubernaculifera TaxID=47775 RepID=A0A7R6ULS3_9CHLO|nr:RNA polymerase beta' subunit [Astrephomene gubernaculifera]
MNILYNILEKKYKANNNKRHLNLLKTQVNNLSNPFYFSLLGKNNVLVSGRIKAFAFSKMVGVSKKQGSIRSIPGFSLLSKSNKHIINKKLEKSSQNTSVIHFFSKFSQNDVITNTIQLSKKLKLKKQVKPFFNFTFDKGRLKNLVSWTLKNYGQYTTVELLEQLKKTGFEYATKAGISLGIDDLKIPPKKNILLLEAEHLTKITNYQQQRADITAIERFQRLIETWHRTSEFVKQEVINYFEVTDILNPVYMMAFSGARGNISQVRQLVGMRGLMSDPHGQIIDFPIRSNFREGLTLTEYIISSYGARKGIVDTALRTANAGYLTRRLVDVAQHVIISHYDCGTQKGVFLTDIKESNKTLVSVQNRIIGRVLARDIYKPNTAIKLFSRNQEISTDLAFEITKITNKIFVRSSLTCNTNKTLCQLCYGWSLAQGNLVSVGEAVGVIAAQAIGEPGTQLTMRTFHTGGVFSGDVSDEIRAPYNGFVHYKNTIPGILMRSVDGKILFLTKSDGTLIISTENKKDNYKQGTKSAIALVCDNSVISKSPKTGPGNFFTYKIPAYTVLFIRNGEQVVQKQVVAQITNLNVIKQNNYDTSEYVIKAEFEGLFYAKNVQIQKSTIGPNPKFIDDKKKGLPSNIKASGAVVDIKAMEIVVKARGWNFAWVLSGKRYEMPFLLKTIPSIGDYITQQTIIAQQNFKLGSNIVPSCYALKQNIGNNLFYPTNTKSFDFFFPFASNIMESETHKNLHLKKIQKVRTSQSLLTQTLATPHFCGKSQRNLQTHNSDAIKHSSSFVNVALEGINKIKNSNIKTLSKTIYNVRAKHDLLFLNLKKIKYHKIGYFHFFNPIYFKENKTQTKKIVSKSNYCLNKKSNFDLKRLLPKVAYQGNLSNGISSLSATRLLAFSNFTNVKKASISKGVKKQESIKHQNITKDNPFKKFLVGSKTIKFNNNLYQNDIMFAPASLKVECSLKKMPLFKRFKHSNYLLEWFTSTTKLNKIENKHYQLKFSKAFFVKTLDNLPKSKTKSFNPFGKNKRFYSKNLKGKGLVASKNSKFAIPFFRETKASSPSSLWNLEGLFSHRNYKWFLVQEKLKFYKKLYKKYNLYRKKSCKKFVTLKPRMLQQVDKIQVYSKCYTNNTLGSSKYKKVLQVTNKTNVIAKKIKQAMEIYALNLNSKKQLPIMPLKLGNTSFNQKIKFYYKEQTSIQTTFLWLKKIKKNHQTFGTYSDTYFAKQKNLTRIIDCYIININKSVSWVNSRCFWFLHNNITDKKYLTSLKGQFVSTSSYGLNGKLLSLEGTDSMDKSKTSFASRNLQNKQELNIINSILFCNIFSNNITNKKLGYFLLPSIHPSTENEQPKGQISNLKCYLVKKQVFQIEKQKRTFFEYLKIAQNQSSIKQILKHFKQISKIKDLSKTKTKKIKVETDSYYINQQKNKILLLKNWIIINKKTKNFNSFILNKKYCLTSKHINYIYKYYLLKGHFVCYDFIKKKANKICLAKEVINTVNPQAILKIEKLITCFLKFIKNIFLSYNYILPYLTKKPIKKQKTKYYVINKKNKSGNKLTKLFIKHIVYLNFEQCYFQSSYLATLMGLHLIQSPLTNNKIKINKHSISNLTHASIIKSNFLSLGNLIKMTVLPYNSKSTGYKYKSLITCTGINNIYAKLNNIDRILKTEIFKKDLIWVKNKKPRFLPKQFEIEKKDKGNASDEINAPSKEQPFITTTPTSSPAPNTPETKPVNFISDSSIGCFDNPGGADKQGSNLSPLGITDNVRAQYYCAPKSDSLFNNHFTQKEKQINNSINNLGGNAIRDSVTFVLDNINQKQKATSIDSDISAHKQAKSKYLLFHTISSNTNPNLVKSTNIFSSLITLINKNKKLTLDVLKKIKKEYKQYKRNNIIVLELNVWDLSTKNKKIILSYPFNNILLHISTQQSSLVLCSLERCISKINSDINYMYKLIKSKTKNYCLHSLYKIKKHKKLRGLSNIININLCLVVFKKSNKLKLLTPYLFFRKVCSTIKQNQKLVTNKNKKEKKLTINAYTKKLNRPLNTWANLYLKLKHTLTIPTNQSEKHAFNNTLKNNKGGSLGVHAVYTKYRRSFHSLGSTLCVEDNERRVNGKHGCYLPLEGYRDSKVSALQHIKCGGKLSQTNVIIDSRCHHNRNVYIKVNHLCTDFFRKKAHSLTFPLEHKLTKHFIKFVNILLPKQKKCYSLLPKKANVGLLSLQSSNGLKNSNSILINNYNITKKQNINKNKCFLFTKFWGNSDKTNKTKLYLFISSNNTLQSKKVITYTKSSKKNDLYYKNPSYNFMYKTKIILNHINKKTLTIPKQPCLSISFYSKYTTNLSEMFLAKQKNKLMLDKKINSNKRVIKRTALPPNCFLTEGQQIKKISKKLKPLTMCPYKYTKCEQNLTNGYINAIPQMFRNFSLNLPIQTKRFLKYEKIGQQPSHIQNASDSICSYFDLTKNILFGKNYFSPFEGELLYTKHNKKFIELNPYQNIKTGLQALKNFTKNKTKQEKIRIAIFSYYLNNNSTRTKIINNYNQKHNLEQKQWSRFNLILTKKNYITLNYNNLNFMQNFSKAFLNCLFQAEIKDKLKLQSITQLNKENLFNKGYKFNLKNKWLKQTFNSIKQSKAYTQFISNIKSRLALFFFKQPTTSNRDQNKQNKKELNLPFSISQNGILGFQPWTLTSKSKNYTKKKQSQKNKAVTPFLKIKISLPSRSLILNNTNISNNKSPKIIYKKDSKEMLDVTTNVHNLKTKLTTLAVADSALLSVLLRLFDKQIVPYNSKLNRKWIAYKQKKLFTKNKIGFFFLKGSVFLNTFTRLITKKKILNAKIYNLDYITTQKKISEKRKAFFVTTVLSNNKLPLITKQPNNKQKVLDIILYTLKCQQQSGGYKTKKGEILSIICKSLTYPNRSNSNNSLKKYVYRNLAEHLTAVKNCSYKIDKGEDTCYMDLNYYLHYEKMHLNKNFLNVTKYQTFYKKQLYYTQYKALFIKNIKIKYQKELFYFLKPIIIKKNMFFLFFKQKLVVDLTLKNLYLFFISFVKNYIEDTKHNIIDTTPAFWLLPPTLVTYLNNFKVLKKSGQLIHMNAQKITIRIGQPIIISPQSTMHATHGDFIRYKTDVVTLTYQQLKTGDIVQGIPKIEQLFEARTTKRGRLFRDNVTNLLTGLFLKYFIKSAYLLSKNNKPKFLDPFTTKKYNKAVRPDFVLRRIGDNSKGEKQIFLERTNNNKQKQTIILALALQWAVKQSFYKIQQIIVDGILRVYRSQGVSIADKHVEIIVKQMTSKVRIINANALKITDYSYMLQYINRSLHREIENKIKKDTDITRQVKKQQKKAKSNRISKRSSFENKLLDKLFSNNLDGPTGLFPGEIVDIDFVENINLFLLKTSSLDSLTTYSQNAFAFEPIKYEPIVLGITRASLEVESFLSAASFQQTTRVLSQAALYKKNDFLKGLKENIIIGNLIPAGTGYLSSLNF